MARVHEEVSVAVDKCDFSFGGYSCSVEMDFDDFEAVVEAEALFLSALDVIKSDNLKR